MYTDYKKPNALNWGSLHLIVLYFTAFLNAIGLALGIEFLRARFCDIYEFDFCNILIPLSVFIIYLFIQVLWIKKYLSKKDKKNSAEKAVFKE